MAKKFTDRTAFDGETLTGCFNAPPETVSVVVRISDGTKEAQVAAVKGTDGRWTATATPQILAGLSGSTRWLVLATTPDGTEAVADGEIFIRAVVSKHRQVVAAIEETLQNYGKSPNKTISVGEVSIVYKDYNDLLAILDFWRKRVAADERGRSQPTAGIKRVRMEFR